ncbi:hypothetical protein JCM10512_524 [Bacteroides reticulotermitis JCM 10512]|uniref:Uncharacterized protein n=1 Tax=Bacteroides reticulotermitis JCM 10512 TaxID=1445607 RepID=W4UNW2_9BACE|nr:hypothetical protein JCM10512_524 [Bacteroides reticulotermitis JCM 10512]
MFNSGHIERKILIDIFRQIGFLPRLRTSLPDEASSTTIPNKINFLLKNMFTIL